MPLAEKGKTPTPAPPPLPKMARVFWGTSARTPLRAIDVEALQGYALVRGFTGPWPFQYDPKKYKYLAYPEAWGQIKYFVDTATKFQVPAETPYVVKIKNDAGVIVPYYVYRSTNMLGGQITVMGV